LTFGFGWPPLTLLLWLALLFEGVGSAVGASIPAPFVPVLMHFNSLTAFEMKG